MPGHVADLRERVELLHLREPEVEQAHVHLVRLGEEHVRRLDVAVDDPLAMGVRERLEHLRRRLDGRRVVELAGGHRLAQRAAGDVLVGDVDVARVARERVDPLAAWVPERGGGARLAVGALGDPALAGDHLQGDVEAVLLVAREPDVPHSAGAERPQRPVAAEDQLVLRGRRSPRAVLLRAGRSPFATGVTRYIRPSRPWTRRTTTSSSTSSTRSRSPPRRPQQRSRVRLPQRRPRGPATRGGGPHSLTPVDPPRRCSSSSGSSSCSCFSLLIASCAGESKHDVYANYMDKVDTIATQSSTDGRQTVTVLTSPGLDAAADREAPEQHRGGRAAERGRGAEALARPGSCGSSTATWSRRCSCA